MTTSATLTRQQLQDMCNGRRGLRTYTQQNGDGTTSWVYDMDGFKVVLPVGVTIEDYETAMQ